MPTRRQLRYLQGLLIFLAFATLVQQLVATRKYFFQIEQVLHHETIALFLVALAIGIAIGTTKSE